MRHLLTFLLILSPITLLAQVNESTGTSDHKRMFMDSLGNEITQEEMLDYLKNTEYAGVKVTRGEDNEMIMHIESQQTVKARREEEGFDADMFEKTVYRSLENKLVGEPMPSVNLRDIMGEQYALNALKGKVVVMNFWFIGCKPCIEEILALNKVVEKFYDKNVVFLAPTFDSEKAVNKFLKKTSFNYKVVPDFSGDEMEKYFDVKLWPTHIIYNKAGEIDSYLLGGQKDIDKVLESLIMHALTDETN